MKIPLEFYELLRNRINISDVIKQKVSLTRKAGEYIGLCPFHPEKTPSFTVNDSKKFYHCFGCNAHGDVIKFTSTLDGLHYKDSAIKLANNFGIEIPKLTKQQERLYEEYEQLSNILSLATEFFQSQLSKESIDYLQSRGIDKKSIEDFNIGYSPSGKLLKFFEKKSIPPITLANAGLIGKREDGSIYEVFHNRVMFPIKNVYSKIVGFGGRTLCNGLPKYLNSPETILFKKGEILYGEDNALSAARRKNYVILVEGYIDVITLHKAGFYETVGALGTAVREKHLSKLWNACDEIICCMDGDLAGLQASKKIINTALPLVSSKQQISFVMLPQNCDPDDVINKYGSSYFQSLLDNKINLSKMIWHVSSNGKRFDTAESRSGLESKLEEHCNKLNDHILKKNYKQFFRDQLWANIKNNRKKTSTTHFHSTNIMPETNYSEIEVSKRALFAWALKFPNILNKEEVKNQLLNLSFTEPNLTQLRDLIIEQVSSINEITANDIQELVKKTGLYSTFLLISSSDILFLDIINIKNITTLEIWDFLYKKYYLSILKQEYATILDNGASESFAKAGLYHQEILKISQELQELMESLVKLQN